MTEKSRSPLKNPPSEKNTNTISLGTKPGINTGISSVKGDVGGSPRGVKRVIPVEAIVRCQMCGQWQKIVFAYGRPPQWHKCIKCNEVQPMDGYRVTMYGSLLPTVLSPTEVANRKEAQRLEKEMSK